MNHIDSTELLESKSPAFSKGHNPIQLYVSNTPCQSEARPSVLQCCFSYYLPTVSYFYI